MRNLFPELVHRKEKRTPEEHRRRNQKRQARVREAMAKAATVSGLENAIKDNNQLITDLKGKLAQAKKEHLRLQIEKQGQPAVIRAEVKEAVHKFDRLFSLPVVKRNWRVLLDGFSHPDFSSKHVASALEAAINHARNKPVHAAIDFVSKDRHMQFETVARYYRSA